MRSDNVGKQEVTMKCPICKHGSTHKGLSSITLERDGATLLFKNVPADICDNCGEIYHDEEVTHSLLEQAEQVSGRGVELDVRQFCRLGSRFLRNPTWLTCV